MSPAEIWPGAIFPPEESPRTTAAVVGFGRTPASFLRDDAVGFWEAWKRASVVERCMAKAGFTWELDTGYGDGFLARVGEVYQLFAGTTPDSGASAANSEAFLKMGRDRQDAYARALWGESGVDMVRVYETGAVPAGSDDSFAMGGCTGKSWAEVGSLWTLRDKYSDEVMGALQEYREASGVRDEYRRCAESLGVKGVTGPDDIEQLRSDAYSSGGSPQFAEVVKATARAVSDCSIIWSNGNIGADTAAVEMVAKRHPAEFEAWNAKYGDVIAQIDADQAFRDFIVSPPRH
jgi:hypothetical protein